MTSSRKVLKVREARKDFLLTVTHTSWYTSIILLKSKHFTSEYQYSVEAKIFNCTSLILPHSHLALKILLTQTLAIQWEYNIINYIYWFNSSLKYTNYLRNIPQACGSSSQSSLQKELNVSTQERQKSKCFIITSPCYTITV